MSVDFGQQERARCAALIKALAPDPFLMFCVKNAYAIEDFETARQRFEEFTPTVAPDEFEDLM